MIDLLRNSWTSKPRVTLLQLDNGIYDLIDKRLEIEMFYLIVGFLGLMLLYAHYAVPKRMYDLKRLDEHGVLTQALVTSARVSERTRKSPIVTLEYKYTDDSGIARKGLEQNISSTFVKSLREGDVLGVKYLPQNSKVNCVADKEVPRSANMWLGIVILLLLDLAIGYGIYSEFFANT